MSGAIALVLLVVSGCSWYWSAKARGDSRFWTAINVLGGCIIPPCLAWGVLSSVSRYRRWQRWRAIARLDFSKVRPTP